MLRRLSLSVLVDQRVRWEGAGAKAKRILEPPKPEEVKAIRDVVAGAVGYSATRGDQLIVESLAFDATLKSTPPPVVAGPVTAAPGFLGMLPESMRSPLALAIGAGGIVAVVLGVALGAFFLLKKRKKKPSAAEVATSALEGAGGKVPEALAAAAGAGRDAAGESGGTQAELLPGQSKTVEEMLAEKESQKERYEYQELAKLQAATISTTKTDILTKHITEEAKKNPEAIAQVLRNWLQEE